MEGDCAESGRLTMQGNALQCIEAQFLSFRYAFYKLDLKEVVSYTYADNTKSLRLSQQFDGILEALLKEENQRSVCKMNNCKEKFVKSEELIKRFLYREGK